MPTKKKTQKTATSTKKRTATRTSQTKKATAKKATSKAPRSRRKTTAKKAASSTAAKTPQQALICVDGEKCFWTNDGQILASIADLRDALQRMNEEVFAHHVTKEKNDFADWVEQVLEDAELSRSLRRAQKPHTARAVVVRRLKAYER